MKRIAAVFMILTILTSCSKTTFSLEYPVTYSGVVSVSYNGSEYSAEVEYTGDNMDVSLISPEILNGYKLNIAGENITVGYDSLTLNYEKENVSTLCPFEYLYDVLSALNESKPEFYGDASLKTTNISVDDSECEVTYDAENMKITAVRYKDYLFVLN